MASATWLKSSKFDLTTHNMHRLWEHLWLTVKLVNKQLCFLDNIFINIVLKLIISYICACHWHFNKIFWVLVSHFMGYGINWVYLKRDFTFNTFKTMRVLHKQIFIWKNQWDIYRVFMQWPQYDIRILVSYRLYPTLIHFDWLTLYDG